MTGERQMLHPSSKKAREEFGKLKGPGQLWSEFFLNMFMCVCVSFTLTLACFGAVSIMFLYSGWYVIV